MPPRLREKYDCDAPISIPDDARHLKKPTERRQQLKGTSRNLLFLLAIGSVMTLGAVRSVASTACEPNLPDAAGEILKAAFPQWRVLQTEDLFSDDRRYRIVNHGAETSVGVVCGIFNPPLGETYAVLLIRSASSRSDTLLLLLVRDGEEWNITPLYEEQSVLHPPVIIRGRPGAYPDFYDRDQVTQTIANSVVYWHMEASAIAFVHTDGEVRRVLVSE